MTNRRRWLAIGVIAVVIIAAVGLIASWKDTQTEFSLHDKINEGINVGMEELYQVAPRVGVIGSDYTYYVPDTNHLNNNTFTVYKDALEYVNSDIAAPIMQNHKGKHLGDGQYGSTCDISIQGLLWGCSSG